MSIIKDKKYAVVISGNPITDYMYDDVTQMQNTIFGIQEKNGIAHTIHAYDKETGKIMFKKENIAGSYIMNDCYIIQLKDSRRYVYFDLEKKIRGPYNDIHVNRYKSIIIVSKVIKNSKGVVKEVYGAYNGDNTLLLPIKYDDISLELDNFIVIQYKEQIGLADYGGEIVFKPQYDGIDLYFNGNILDLYSSKRETSTLIDEYGDIVCVLDTKYSIDADEELKLLFVENDGMYGIYDDEGEEIFSIVLDNYCINRDVVEVRIGRRKFAYIPKVDTVVYIEDYRYTKNGKLKFYDGHKWHTIK